MNKVKRRLIAGITIVGIATGCNTTNNIPTKQEKVGSLEGYPIRSFSAGAFNTNCMYFSEGAHKAIAEAVVLPELEPEVKPQVEVEPVMSSPIRRYNPTEEEFRQLCFRTYAEAGDQGFEGMLYVACCAVNFAISKDITLEEEMNCRNRYSTVTDGKVYIGPKSNRRLVTDKMITDELKAVVQKALECDYTEAILKEIALEKGLDAQYYEGGALYFYDPDGLSSKAKAERKNLKVTFKHKGHVFFRFWDEWR